MSDRQSTLLAERRQLLEIEAQIQRATLAASLATLEERRSLAWGATLASTALKAFGGAPRLKWIVAASILNKFRNRRRK